MGNWQLVLAADGVVEGMYYKRIHYLSGFDLPIKLISSVIKGEGLLERLVRIRK